MAATSTYGIGQIRYDSGIPYISLLYNSTQHNNDSNGINYKNSESGYRDLYIRFPRIIKSGSGISVNEPMIKYGETYYMKLKIPQNPSYETVLLFKLCDSATNSTDIDINRYQVINRLTIPPTPTTDDDFCNVLLFEDPVTGNTRVQLLDSNHDTTSGDYVDTSSWMVDGQDKWAQLMFSNYQRFLHFGDVYKKQVDDVEYYYYTNANFTPEQASNFTIEEVEGTQGGEKFVSLAPKIINYTLVEGWKTSYTGSSQAYVEYDFIFTPKFNLESGFPFLYIEIVREGDFQDTIQYNEGGTNYSGTYIKKEDLVLELYKVNDLLEQSMGLSQIGSGTATLNHIAISGHPNQPFAINGEEIRLGPSGFYELDDYDINFLGAAVNNENANRFTVDYEYKIVRNT